MLTHQSYKIYRRHIFFKDVTRFLIYLVLVYQHGDYIHVYVPYGEYGHRGYQSRLSSLLDEGEQIKPEEGLCFLMYPCIY